MLLEFRTHHAKGRKGESVRTGDDLGGERQGRTFERGKGRRRGRPTGLENGLEEAPRQPREVPVPELAGRYWSGRALGAQNTVERLMVAVGPPVFGELISASGYPLAFAVCGLFPLAALPFLPVTAYRSGSPACSRSRPT